jgi:putative ubiquitin-RnfH superfamily antitoxin RatB of RatAB toxin-antitoxin module
VNVAIFIVEILGIVAMVVVHRRSLGIFSDRLRAQDEAEEGRRVALYKQQKQTSKAVAQSDRAGRKLADETRHLKGEVELALSRIDRHMSDQKQGEGNSR